MPDQRTLEPGEQDAQDDSVVLSLMVNTEHQRLWSFDEIEREMGSNPIDSLNRLYGAGLIHRFDRYSWATRAALMADEIKM